ncbi:sporulation protein [Vibrio sp.]|uniref:Sporulation control protein Spo0M n=1 Tax=Vibrio viridaestus TaxID=2487322 RepID=A0A3N9TC29_9VIBR|nr:sporulation protein [Vibrio viridaestus]MDC0610869.1 sporulation protein [Vibrio sp.]RQW61283.1 sporulation control protein Spo0M [Vibrio viridaestus]
MSFIKKTLSTFGIGSAKVDSVLQQEVLYPGEKASIVVHVYGGSTMQDIDNIEMRLCARYIGEELPPNKDRDNGYKRRVHKTHTLASWSLPYAFRIEPGETRDFTVEFNLPWNMPITVGDTKVWLETGLDISLAIDPRDTDILTVRPDPLLDAVFSAFEEQGLRLRQVECEEAKGFSLPFVQEFEFVPTTGPFHGRWRELEIIACREADKLKLWFEVDRAAKGVGGMLANMLGKGELKRYLEIPLSTPIGEVGDKVLSYLDETS